MSRNYDIQTVSEHLDNADLTAEIGEQVADGMTRYVTFIRVESMVSSNGTGSKVFFCSTPLASGAITCGSATFAQKMVVYLVSASNAGRKDVMVPPSPDTEHPLFTVASAAYLRALLSTAVLMTGSVQIFVQYYDE